jgi:HEAT repeat protein
MKTLAGCLGAALLLCTGSVLRADVKNLIQDLQSKDPDIRRTAARELGRQGADDKAAVGALTKALKDEDSFVRRFAALSLGQLGPQATDAVPALTAALKDRDLRVIKAATTALGKMGASGVQPLLGVVKDERRDPAVRTQAIQALGQIGADAKDAVPTLRDLLVGKMITKGKKKQRKMEEVSLRVEAIQALGQMGPAAKEAQKTLEEIVAAKKGVDRNVKQAARLALRKIKK